MALPLWVLLIGAVGISLGLALFGPTVIKTVGEKITKMNPSRAYCVALSAATTVLVASALGLPVSSTHITVGGVFGIGLLREAITNSGIPNPGVSRGSRSLNVSGAERDAGAGGGADAEAGAEEARAAAVRRCRSAPPG